jgi:carboxyl-terminal processing protease
VRGFKLDQVSRKLLGKPGTAVDLVLLREGVSEPIRYRLTRATVHVPGVPYAMLFNGHVGYVSLQRFNDMAGDELSRAVQTLTARGATSMILDLRGNPGGDLEQSIRVANIFLPPDADVVTVRYRNRPTEVRRTTMAPTVPQLPLIVLTDSSSASASEIVAGALQDHDRAVLLGTTSFGKGVVQTLYPLDGGWTLKLTNAKWYTPSGRSIQRDRAEGDSAVKEVARPAFKSTHGRTVLGGGGIVPDVEVAADTLSTIEQQLQRSLAMKARESNATLQQLARDLKPKLRYDFTVQPAWRDTLYRRLNKAGVEVTKAQWDGSRPMVDRLIEQRLARTAFGDSAAFRRWAPSDAQLRRALDLLTSAKSQEDLLAMVEGETKVGVR